MRMIKKDFTAIIFGLAILVSISAGVTPESIPESKIVTLADDGQTITLRSMKHSCSNWEKGLIGSSPYLTKASSAAFRISL